MTLNRNSDGVRLETRNSEGVEERQSAQLRGYGLKLEKPNRKIVKIDFILLEKEKAISTFKRYNNDLYRFYRVLKKSCVWKKCFVFLLWLGPLYCLPSPVQHELNLSSPKAAFTRMRVWTQNALSFK